MFYDRSLDLYASIVKFDGDLSGYFGNVSAVVKTPVSKPRDDGFDLEKYMALIDEPGLSEAQKIEMIEALWPIIIGFVDLGFGTASIHSVAFEKACGKRKTSLEAIGSKDSNETDQVNNEMEARPDPVK